MTPRIFFVSVHSAPKVPAKRLRQILERYGIAPATTSGRPSGLHYKAHQVLKKISAALLDEGAIPLQHYGKEISPHSLHYCSEFFITGLSTAWAGAIDELAAIGVRLYILPTLRAFEGLPDAVADSFDAYYLSRLNQLYNKSESGVNVSDVLEVLISQSLAFEAEEIVFGDDHNELVEKIRGNLKLIADDAAKFRDAINSAPIAPPADFSIDDIPDDL